MSSDTGDGANESLLDDETIARAQAALKAMTSFFDEAMDEDVSALHAARNALHLARPTAELVRALLVRADSLAAQGNLLDVPLVAALAGSLHILVTHVPEPDEIPLVLVDAHVDALKALGRAGAKRETNPASAEIVCLLRRSVHRTVADWQRAQGG